MHSWIKTACMIVLLAMVAIPLPSAPTILATATSGVRGGRASAIATAAATATATTLPAARVEHVASGRSKNNRKQEKSTALHGDSQYLEKWFPVL